MPDREDERKTREERPEGNAADLKKKRLAEALRRNLRQRKKATAVSEPPPGKNEPGP